MDLQKEQYNIQNSIRQLQNFMDTFEQFINPFDVGIPKNLLINMSSGKAASVEVEKFLLNIEENGDTLRKTFIAECEADIRRFEKSIKRTPTIAKFFSRLFKKKNQTKIGGKVQEVRIQRDLFGRMLGISINYKIDIIDIARILSYPITPVPLCHFDGAICKIQNLL